MHSLCCCSCCRHYPIGVLFDLYASNDGLPWNITVHFKVGFCSALDAHKFQSLIMEVVFDSQIFFSQIGHRFSIIGNVLFNIVNYNLAYI